MQGLFSNSKTIEFYLDLRVQSLEQNIDHILTSEPEGEVKEALKTIFKGLFPLVDRRLAGKLDDYKFEVNVVEVPNMSSLSFRLFASLAAIKKFTVDKVDFEEIVETVSIRKNLNQEAPVTPEVKRPVFTVVK